MKSIIMVVTIALVLSAAFSTDIYAQGNKTLAIESTENITQMIDNALGIARNHTSNTTVIGGIQ